MKWIINGHSIQQGFVLNRGSPAHIKLPTLIASYYNSRRNRYRAKNITFCSIYGNTFNSFLIEFDGTNIRFSLLCFGVGGNNHIIKGFIRWSQFDWNIDYFFIRWECYRNEHAFISRDINSQ